MKALFFRGIFCTLISCLLLCTGCNSSSERSEQKMDRSRWVAALKEMKRVVDANDAAGIRQYFPQQTIKDSYMEYAEVVGACKGFLAQLEIAKLQSGDSVGRMIVQKESPCREKYTIVIAADSVTFAYVMDKNPDYKKPQQNTEDEIDQSSLCEHMQWYHFRLVDGQLKLTSLGGAD